MVLIKKFKDYIQVYSVSWDNKTIYPRDILIIKSRVPIKLSFKPLDNFIIFSIYYIILSSKYNKFKDRSTVEEINKSYREIKSSIYNRYINLDRLNYLPYTILFSVELYNLRPLSDILVGRRDWNSLAIREEYDKLLSLSPGKLSDYLKA